MRKKYITQGEFAISRDPNEVVVTLLGSCVATCLWDPTARVGGMNHFILPTGSTTQVSVTSFGAHAMEMLINGLIKEGAARHNLRARVFGGAKMSAGLTDAGDVNAAFVLDYLRCEAIVCEASDLGGTQARRLNFQATVGHVECETVEDRGFTEVRPKAPARTQDAELF